MKITVQRNKNFTVMGNYHLRDKNLSLKAIGLMSKVLGLPDDWAYSMSGLISICKEGREAVSGALKELKKYGYFEMNKRMPSKDNPTFDYDYTFYENPAENPNYKPVEVQEKPKKQGNSLIIVTAGSGVKPTKDVEKLGVENQDTEKPSLDNPQELNINKQNINELNINNNTCDTSRKSTSRFQIPTVAEVKSYITSKNYNNIDPEVFVAYYESNGWRVGKSPMKNWRAALLTWQKNSYNHKTNKNTFYGLKAMTVRERAEEALRIARNANTEYTEHYDD